MCHPTKVGPGPFGEWVGVGAIAKGPVIGYREWGATKWENRRSKSFCPPPQHRVKLFKVLNLVDMI